MATGCEIDIGLRSLQVALLPLAARVLDIALFRRGERPALERNIIDTPKRTRANYRNVMGSILVCEDIRTRLSELATLCKIVWTLV